MKDLESPEMKQKFTEGPVGVLNLKRPGPQAMGPMLGQWFLFSLVISFIVAYAACHSVPPGTPYLGVFRVVGTIAWLAYAGGQIPAAIWMGKPWSVTVKDVFDGLLYGCVTAGRSAGSGPARTGAPAPAPGSAPRRSRSPRAAPGRARRWEPVPRTAAGSRYRVARRNSLATPPQTPVRLWRGSQ